MKGCKINLSYYVNLEQMNQRKLKISTDDLRSFLSADSISSALLVGLSGEEGRKERKIIFKFFGRNGRIEGLELLLFSQYLAVA